MSAAKWAPRVLVIVPTYNERENLTPITDRVFASVESADFTVNGNTAMVRRTAVRPFKARSVAAIARAASRIIPRRRSNSLRIMVLRR